MWTYDFTDHIMKDMTMVIALPAMTFIVRNQLYELHPMDVRVFYDFIKKY